MRITLSLVAAIGLLAGTQRAEAQTITGQPTTTATTSAAVPMPGTVQILPGTSYQPSVMTTSSESTRRGLFGRRILRRGNSSQVVSPSAPLPAFLPMTMPSPTTTSGTTTTSGEKKPESGVKTASGTNSDGGVTTAGLTVDPSKSQGTIIPAGATVMTSNGMMMMSSNGTLTMMPGEMMSTTTEMKAARRGLLSRLRR